MLSLLLLVSVARAMPIIDLGVDTGGGWDVPFGGDSSVVVQNIVPPNLNPLPTPIVQTPNLPFTPLPQYIPSVPTTNYDLGVAQVPQYQVPQYQIPQVQVPQYQIPQVQVPQYQIPQYQVPQYQIPQVQVQVPQVPQVQVPPVPQPTEITPPPTTFPKGD